MLIVKLIYKTELLNLILIFQKLYHKKLVLSTAKPLYCDENMTICIKTTKYDNIYLANCLYS